MSPRHKSEIEKFIGENLINKIGIVITVIGIAIGAEYAIDQEIINPLSRIVYGYLPGLGLLMFGLRLKNKYKNYSAVMVSLAMGLMYFFTYALYNIYHLMPQISAFILMVIFSALTVVAAVFYKRQVIAHIGLVGAYAIPFLFGDGSERIEILFGYISILNIGILIIAFNKSWKSLYYSSFLLTWLQFFLWYESKFLIEEHYELTLIFLYIFFSTFYVTFLIYKLLRRTRFQTLDTMLILTNSFIFFGVGYVTLHDHETGEQLLGLFTISMALVHLILSAIIYRQKLEERILFYLVSGLVVVFTTATIPIQFSGNWVTILWAGEAMVLFWIGRIRKVTIYEKLSYPIMLIAFASLVHDWSTVYGTYYTGRPETRISPLLNFNFVTSLIFIVFFGVINILNFKIKFPSPSMDERVFLKITSFFMSAFLLSALYYSFQIEIATYWNQLYADAVISLDANGQQYQNYKLIYELRNLKTVWIINYSLFFLVILSFVNAIMIRSRKLAPINLIMNTVVIAFFLTHGLYVLSKLSEHIVLYPKSDTYLLDIINNNVRYLSMVLVAILLIASNMYIRGEFIKRDIKIAFELILYSTILWIASSELIYWINIAEPQESYKLGLSVFWGCYSFLLIIVGIWKKKKHLRIAAISLFTISLTKLLVFDISNLNTITIVIALISTGILLLITSFLYNKKNI